MAGADARDRPAAGRPTSVGLWVLDREPADILSEDRVEGLVRPAYRARRFRRLAGRTELPTPLRWGTRRRKTARPGPSPASEWMMSGSRGIARTSRTLRTANIPSSKAPSTSRTTPQLTQRSPNSFHRGLRAGTAEPARPPQPPPTKAIRQSPLSDSNRRPLPYHGSALPAELRGRWRGA
jgi:hypothetical protein